MVDVHDPFGMTADPSAYVARDSTDSVLAALEARVLGDDAKPVALLGPPGLGKTMLLHVLAERVESRMRSVYVPYAALSAAEMCNWALQSFGELAADDSEAALLDWAFRLGASGSGLLLLIDDASALPAQTARGMGVLASASGGALRLVVAAIDDAKGREAVDAFGPDVSRLELNEPMSLAETANYLHTRLEVGGVPKPVQEQFDEACVAYFHSESEGVPRRLNEIASNFLKRQAPEYSGQEAAEATARSLAMAESTLEPEPEPETETELAPPFPVAELEPEIELEPLIELEPEPIPQVEEVRVEADPEPETPVVDEPAQVAFLDREETEEQDPFFAPDPEPEASEPQPARGFGVTPDFDEDPQLPPTAFDPVPRRTRPKRRRGRGRGGRSVAPPSPRLIAAVVVFVAAVAALIPILSSRLSDSPTPTDAAAPVVVDRPVVEEIEPTPTEDPVLDVLSEPEVAVEPVREPVQEFEPLAEEVAEIEAISEVEVVPTSPVIAERPEIAEAGGVEFEAAVPTPDALQSTLDALRNAEPVDVARIEDIPKSDPPEAPALRPAEPETVVAAVVPESVPGEIVEEVAPSTLDVNVNATPWAIITVDGVELGETPLAGVPLVPGAHRFVAQMPDGRIFEREIEISPSSRFVVFE